MSMRTRFSSIAAALALCGAAQAQQPFGTLAFDQPTGTVAANQAIDVWVTFTLDPSSAPLVFTSNPLTGLDTSTAPTNGTWYDSDGNAHNGTITAFTGAYLNTYYGCSGTFTHICSPGAYQFNFHTSSTPGEPSINFLDNFDLQPGESYTYLFGEFDPVGGVAAPGTYTFYVTGLTLNYLGPDANNDVVSASIDLASTCPSSDASCAFTRTVTAVSSVPEPASYATMALGLLMLAGAARRRGR